MLKYFLLFLFILFNSCSIKQNTNLKVNSINNTYTYDICTDSSYINLSYDEVFGKLFTEFIRLKPYCHWNGFQRGYFEELFSSTLKLKSFKAIQRLDFNNYEFSKYLINNQYYLDLIYKFGANGDKLIIDYEGKLSLKMIKRFYPNYINKFLNKPRFNVTYYNSLVKMNFINKYFYKEKKFLLLR